MAGAALKRLMAEYKRKSARKVENFVLILISTVRNFSHRGSKNIMLLENLKICVV